MSRSICSQRKDVRIIMEKIEKYLPVFDKEKFLKAFDFANNAHSGQKRKSGEDYIIHPLCTAEILSELRADENTLIAALLHDVPEDTKYGIETISVEFGDEISFLVEGITKLSKVYYRNDMEERQVASLKKMLMHTARDLRVVLIKLADRLHNMRTLDAIPELKKRVRISSETMEIYVPIANLLGMSILKDELEDLCFRHLSGKEYERMSEVRDNSLDQKESIADTIVKILKEKFEEKSIKASISNKKRSLYRIYKGSLLSSKGVTLEDFLEFSLTADSTENCYMVLGIIHETFKPKPNCFEDHIAVPTYNGRKCLNTSVFSLDGLDTKFYISTTDMQKVNKYGILAPYFVGGGQEKLRNGLKIPWWADRIMSMQHELKDNKSFMEELKLDVFRDRIFTFTPKGDLIDLPQGATCIDFAYSIHTDVGHKATKAIINNNQDCLTTALKNGDSVDIITDENQEGPRRFWLNYVRTNIAKKRIKDWYKKRSNEQKIEIGRKVMQRELNKMGEDIDKILKSRIGGKLCSYFECEDNDDFLVKIADGALDSKEIFKHICGLCKMDSVDKGFGKSIDNTNRIFRIWIKVIGEDRVGLASDLLSPITGMGVNIHGIRTVTRLLNGDAVITLSLDVHDLDEVEVIFKKIEAIDAVRKVQTIIPKRVKKFYAFIGSAFLFWLAHPFILNTVTHMPGISNIISTGLFFAGVLALFQSILFVKQISHKTYPEWRDTKMFWIAVLTLINVATLTVIGEMIWLDVHVNIVVALLFLGACYSIFLFDYFKTKIALKAVRI